MATISPIKTKRVFFSIRWKILIAFLLILGASFYTIATLLVNMVGGYLFDTKIAEESAVTLDLAVSYAQAFDSGDTQTLNLKTEQAARDLGARILLIDMDGKVQVDTSMLLNGWRISNPEVVSVLGGADSDYGFHLLSGSSTPREGRAIFDFLREKEISGKWAGYFSQKLVSPDGEPIGLVLLSISVQDMVDALREIQDKMIVTFLVAALAVFIIGMVFSRIITRPIAVLTEGIERMGSGDLSGRVKVTGGDEIARLGETFNQMSERLENLDTTRNEFVSNASHELKTPLATMKIMLESMIYDENMDPALRSEFLTDINKELDRLSNIVTDLLTLVQTDAQEYKPNRKHILLRDVAEETVRRLSPLAEEREQSLSFSAQASAPIFADHMKIQQIITNLVDNAIKYTPVGGKVRVAIRQEGESAVLEVIDNGPGIPKKDQQHIFDRFYRVDRARSRATGGNGLGLSIVNQAVLMHGGRISVHSEEGKGALFRVELPLST